MYVTVTACIPPGHAGLSSVPADQGHSDAKEAEHHRDCDPHFRAYLQKEPEPWLSQHCAGRKGRQPHRKSEPAGSEQSATQGGLAANTLPGGPGSPPT